MHIKDISVGPFQANCILIWNDEKEALVIDPGFEGDRLLGMIEEADLKVIAYPMTHGHADHVCALHQMFEACPAPVGMHPLDTTWAFTAKNRWEPFYEIPTAPDRIEREWADGQTWVDGGMKYEIIHTPGHSPGGVCFYFAEEKVLISGDTLFQGSVGRTDLPGADMQTLMNSLRRLVTLPDDTRVFPGHGPPTTIGHEKKMNPFLQAH